MYSRAHLLIELEQERLLADPPWGIEAGPLRDDSIFEWMAKIKGLRNTPWEDGIFTVYIKFDEHYNVRPPTVFFQTVPFHPNVDVTSGRPCVDFLDNCHVWNEDYSLSMVLVTLQTLLSNPVCENAVNVDAARMLLTSPDLYDQMTKECVANSQVVEAKGAQIVSNEPAVPVHKPSPADKPLITPPKVRSIHTKKLSFEEYHKTWLSIATSKPEPNAVNLMMDSIKEKSGLQKIHLGLSREEAEQVTTKQLQTHNMLVYGSMKSCWELEKDSKLEKLNRMKQIYLPSQQAALTEICDGNTGKTFTDVRLQTKADIPEEEVDDLVQWSHNLDSNFLDQS